MHTRALLALGFTIIVWGVTSVFVRAFSLAAGPMEALIIRLIAVAIVFLAVLAVSTGFSIARKDWPRLLAISFIGMLGYFTFTVFGFMYAPAGIGTLIMSTQPMLIAILARFAGTEKLSVMTVFGLLVSFAGSVLLVSGDDLGTAGASNRDVVFGCVLIFFSGVAWSIYVVFSRSLIQTYGALKITGISNIVIVLPLLPLISGNTVNTLTSLPQDAIISLLFLTFIGATASVVTWNYAAGIVKPSLLGAALYVVPVLAVLAGWAMLDEKITSHIVIAAAIILAGVAISQVQWGRRRNESPA